MIATVSWAICVLVALLGIAVSMRVVETVTGPRGIASRRGALIVASATAVILGGLGGLYRVRAVAEADGTLVKSLSALRSPVLVQVFRVVTTMGDVIPCLIIAGALGIYLYRFTSTSIWALTLPVLVLLEVFLQIGFAHLFHPITLTDVMPRIVIDRSGSIPSGSVARLLSLTLVAAMVRAGATGKTGRAIPTTGAIVVFIELISRLYLGRHLVGDLFGGLLLGVLLSLGVAAVLRVAVGVRKPNIKRLDKRTGERPVR